MKCENQIDSEPYSIVVNVLVEVQKENCLRQAW
jgi:hypothetical protein